MRSEDRTLVFQYPNLLSVDDSFRYHFEYFGSNPEHVDTFKKQYPDYNYFVINRK